MQTLSIDQLVGQVLGNYRVERLLGRGRLNAVYLARNLSSQRSDDSCALTLYLVPERFSPEARNRFIARFRKEAAAITTLDHPHILPVYEYGEHSGCPYLVTPYMMNGSLADMLKQQGRFDQIGALSILEQLASGLSYAHQKGFIHGTLRPSNVVLDSEGTMLVAGFGLMHILQMRGIEHNDQQYGHLLSIADTFLAAPEYVAPEVVQGQFIDVRSDVYALGCILFELLSGQPPFTGTNPLEVAKMHVTQAIPSLRTLNPNVPIALVSVVNQALDRDPVRRFQQVSELTEAFVQVSQGTTSQLASGVNQVIVPKRRIEQLQDTPAEGLPSTGWQLQPPIVTSKVSAVNVPAKPAPKRSSQPTLVTGDSWQLMPPVVTSGLPVIKTSTTPGSVSAESPAPSAPQARVPAPPTMLPVSPQEQVNPAPAAPASASKVPSGPASLGSPAALNSMPGVGVDTTELVKSYEWWSHPDPTPEAPPAAQQPAQSRPAQDALRLSEPETINWTTEPSAGFGAGFDSVGSMPSGMSKKRSRGMSRRKVVALLAGGGVAAAGVVVALNLGQLGKSAANMGTAGNTTVSTNPNVIGSTTLALNDWAKFTNPADKKAGVLVHLPNGNFVAYERACTHVGVYVNYDPKSKTLICPAHGAIFDPAQGGKVLQGPATQPLPKVTIHVNSDGTIMV